MKRSLNLFVMVAITFVLCAAGQASAQWHGPDQGTPRDGACFYVDVGYGNRSFCLAAGQSMNSLPSGFNDQISSIRVFGQATVTVYEDRDFQGMSQTFGRDQNDLRYTGGRDNGSRDWNDRISSIRVDVRQYDDRAYGDRDGDRDDDRGYGAGPVWGRGPKPEQGACFFRDTNFQGDYFCVLHGKSLRALPPGFNDSISSIRVFGRTRVTVFQDIDFRGAGARFRHDAPDLRDSRARDSDREWNDRISSIRVDVQDGNREYEDRDRDRGDNRGYDAGPVWGRGPQPDQGACFFRDTNFQGDYFCVSRGESFRALPPGFNDSISSIRIFGGARVTVFQDVDFRGAGARFNQDAVDLRDSRARDSGRDWNDRISSVQVD